MNKLAIVYWSGTGNTEVMANCIAEGAKEAGAEENIALMGAFVTPFHISEKDWLAAVDAAVLPKFTDLNKKAFLLGRRGLTFAAAE